MVEYTYHNEDLHGEVRICLRLDLSSRRRRDSDAVSNKRQPFYTRPRPRDATAAASRTATAAAAAAAAAAKAARGNNATEDVTAPPFFVWNLSLLDGFSDLELNT